MSISKVAKRAGVSVATVSRVINRFPGVSTQTAKQVRAAMRQLSYVPAEVRPGPKLGSQRIRSRMPTETIAVLTVGQPSSEWLRLPVMAAAFAGITEAAKARHLRLLVDEMRDPEQVSALITRREIDGAIVFRASRLGHDGFDGLLAHRLPLVWMLGALERPAQIDHVTADNIAIGYLAHEYLAGRGCCDIAFFTEFPEWPLMRMRGQALANAARDAAHRITSFVVGQNSPAVECYGLDVHCAATLETLVDQLVSMTPRPTGIFSSMDLLTLKLYPLLQSRGVVPGRDVTIVSCDNQESFLSMLSPRPASIDLRAQEIGRRAVARLMERIECPEESPLLIQVPPTVGTV